MPFPFQRTPSNVAAAYIQEHWREHNETVGATKAIQASWRGHEARVEAHTLRAIVHIQHAFRAHRMRHDLQRLTIFSEATGVGARAASVHTWPSVSLIQRHWRSHRLRRRWAEIIQTLHKRYLDETEIERAHQGDKWYSPAMMLRRERLWRSDCVHKALDEAWEAVSAASFRRHHQEHGTTRSTADLSDDPDSLSWPQYFEMSSRLHTALTRSENPREAMRVAKVDFERDTRDWPDHTMPFLQRRLTKDAFKRSFFELADVQTHDLTEQELLAFLEDMAHTLVKVDQTSGAYVLRSHAEIADLVNRHTARHKLHKRLSWEHAPIASPRSKNKHYQATTAASEAGRRSKFDLDDAATPWDLVRRETFPRLSKLPHHTNLSQSLPASNSSSRRPSASLGHTVVSPPGSGHTSRHSSRPGSAGQHKPVWRI